MESYSAKKECADRYYSKINLQNIILRERTQTQKAMNMIPFT